MQPNRIERSRLAALLDELNWLSGAVFEDDAQRKVVEATIDLVTDIVQAPDA